MNKLTGLHHLAICTSDMKSQIEFFTDVVGMELVALYWMHGVENTWHGFLRMNDESCIALVQNPSIAEVPVEMGVTHAGNPGGPCARGTMQHLALGVEDEVELMAMRDRIRARGVPVMGRSRSRSGVCGSPV
jgi:catechol 2,3-dioxygenase-like lactoylglutathione lyase family enzyme